MRRRNVARGFGIWSNSPMEPDIVCNREGPRGQEASSFSRSARAPRFRIVAPATSRNVDSRREHDHCPIKRVQNPAKGRQRRKIGLGTRIRRTGRGRRRSRWKWSRGGRIPKLSRLVESSFLRLKAPDRNPTAFPLGDASNHRSRAAPQTVRFPAPSAEASGDPADPSASRR